MQIVRYRYAGREGYGRLEAGQIYPISDPFGGPPPRGVSEGGPIPRDQVQWLPPCKPGKILAVARNFPSHLQGRTQPTEPQFSLKPASSVVGHGEAVVLPAGSRRAHYEGELAVIIGKRGKGLSREQVLAHVLGYACANDVSEKDWQGQDLQWWRAKGSDTFCPLGPWIETDFDPGAGRSITRLNGEVVQQGAFRDWAFDIEALVCFASRHVTLDPGDVFLMGTPGVTGPLKAGDVVEIDIPGVGVLTNPVVSA